MTVIGFNFTKIEVVKNEGVTGKINIKNNVSVKDVVEQPLDLGGGKQKAIKFMFEFVSNYETGLGHISLTGDIVYIGDDKETKEIIAEWKKAKKVTKEVMEKILNTILNKCNIEALILSQKVNLPSPIPLPQVSRNQGEKK
ncbi:MAG: hypothetical protein O2779_04810 [Nanoarchaeota archaeon]|nr:hypothetical protein [Nanoarchaeota archaeon]